MAVAQAGISSLGVKLGYAVGGASSIPTSFTCLERVNSIGGISLPSEQIDASALEDYATRYIAGRQDSGGEWEVTFNFTSEVETQLKAMITAYKNKGETDVMWFEVYSPYNTKAFFVVAQPPLVLPMPEFSQNELQTIALTFSVENYKGTATAVEPTIS